MLRPPFRLEREMYEGLDRCLSLLTPSAEQNKQVMREPVIGSVVPDLLIAEWRGPLQHYTNLQSNIARHICAFLEDNPSAGAELLSAKLHVSDSGLVKTLANLKRTGAVTESSAGQFALSPLYRSDNVVFTAVELKMSRWKQALQQAESYLEFADRSYVLLDGSQVNPTPEILTAFENSAVGLLLRCGDICGEVVHALPRRPTSPLRLFALRKLAENYTPE